MHRSLWVPRSRAEPFFPLCPRRPSWIHHTQAGKGLPPARHAPSGIIRTRLRRCVSSWRVCCCGNCLTVLFADRARNDPPHRYRLQLRTKSDANDSALFARHPRSVLLCCAFPEQYNASSPENLLAGVRFGCRRRTGSTAREAALPDSDPAGADKIISASAHKQPRSAVYSPPQSAPACKSPP
jgi:hypothetical protein